MPDGQDAGAFGIGVAVTVDGVEIIERKLQTLVDNYMQGYRQALADAAAALRQAAVIEIDNL